MRVTFTTVNGIPTRYHHEGPEGGGGDPLLLIHGGGIAGSSWLCNIDALGRDFRVVAPDCLGQGFTGSGDYRGGPPQPPTLDHLQGLVDQLGWDRFAVAGSSFGAMIGILLHLRMPKRVDKLILLSSGSATLSEAEIAKSLDASFANGMSAVADPTYANCLKRLQNVFYNPADVPPELILMQCTEYRLPGVREAYEARLRGLMDIEAVRPWRVAERLHEVTAQTLLIWGLNDPRTIYERAREAARAIPGSVLVGFENCKHLPHLEQPARFNDLARRFLKGEAIEGERFG